MPASPIATTESLFETVLETIRNVETADLRLLETLDQVAQKRLIDALQSQLHESLGKGLPDVEWQSLYRLTQKHGDTADVYGTFPATDHHGIVIIELDKWRADQISKKFLSRFALTLEMPLIYIALCYGGTAKMNKNECEKYFGYCRNICDAFTQNNARVPERFYGHILR